MLENSDFLIIFLLQYFSFTLSLMTVFLMFIFFFKNKIVNNDLKHLLKDTMDAYVRKTRAYKGVDAKAAKQNGLQIQQANAVGLETIVGPDVAGLINLIPGEAKEKVIKGIMENPAAAMDLIKGFQGQQAGAGAAVAQQGIEFID